MDIRRRYGREQRTETAIVSELLKEPIMDTEKARKILTDAEREANNFGLYGFAKRAVAHQAIQNAFEAGVKEKVEKVRQAIFNTLSGEAEVNTGMMLAAVYDALGFPGVDQPPSTSTPN